MRHKNHHSLELMRGSNVHCGRDTKMETRTRVCDARHEQIKMQIGEMNRVMSDSGGSYPSPANEHNDEYDR